MPVTAAAVRRYADKCLLSPVFDPLVYKFTITSSIFLRDTFFSCSFFSPFPSSLLLVLRPVLDASPLDVRANTWGQKVHSVTQSDNVTISPPSACPPHTHTQGADTHTSPHCQLKPLQLASASPNRSLCKGALTRSPSWNPM